jgi:hypothetical protein
MNKRIWILTAAMIGLVACGDRAPSGGSDGAPDDAGVADEDVSLAGDVAASNSQTEAVEASLVSVTNTLAGVDQYRSASPSDCLEVPGVQDYEWLDGEVLSGWGYEVVFTDCTLYGNGEVSGYGIISFDNLYALPDTATNSQLAAAAANDVAQIASGDIDLFAEVFLTDNRGDDLLLAGESHYDLAELDSDWVSRARSVGGQTVEASWSGSTSVQGDVVSRDAEGEITVTGAQGDSVTSGMVVSGIVRDLDDDYPSAGSVRLTVEARVGERGMTLTFDADTPATGEAVLSNDNGGSATVQLPTL